ncbi:MAG TPA: hypothetical protein VLA21_07300 [Candidatus Limnocylindria bacterium]|nr:hypothetical protein [Candidatus Limnocylindria bacterium]
MDSAAHRGVPAWVRLDNAAKIYPAAKTRGWMPMFRVTAVLRDDVDPDALQRALDAALARVPLFGYRLRRGLFWYYLERQRRTPRVEPDARNPLLPINLTPSKGFLFRVRYFRKRVALEVFHAVADGYGASVFLLTMMAEYVFLRYGERVPPGGLVLDTRERPQPEEWEDSFPRYARSVVHPRGEEAAWRLDGTPDETVHLHVVTGVMPTDRLLEAARERKASVTHLLAALLLQALLKRKKGTRRGRNRPVKVSLPVNLRRYYPSKTLRNFSFYVNVPVRSDYADYTLDQLILIVKSYMALETLEPLLNARFSANVRSEQNPILRAAPLVVKDLVLKFMFRLMGERLMTCTLSNLGQYDVPPQMQKHIERLDIINGRPNKNPLSCLAISACGVTSVSFSRTIRESEVERDFFTGLVELGVPVTVEGN